MPKKTRKSKPTLESLMFEAIDGHRHYNEDPVDCIYRLLHEKRELEKKIIQIVLLPDFGFFTRNERLHP